MPEQPAVLYVRPDPNERSSSPVWPDGWSVRTALSHGAARESIDESEPDYVVCDHAPDAGVDGLELLEAVRATHPSLPVLLCTPEPDGRVAAAATRLDVTEYVPRSEADPAERIRVRWATADRTRSAEADRDSLQQLAQLTADDTFDDDELIERVLALGADRLGLPLGYLSHIEDGTYEVTNVVGDHSVIEAGIETDLANTYCSRTIEGEGLMDIQNAPAEGWADHPSYREIGLACYLGGEVQVNGELYGTMCFAADDARPAPFTDGQRTFIELLIQWTSRELERRRRKRDLEQYENVLEAVDDGVYALDETGHFELVNDAMGELTGHDTEALLGEHTSYIKPDEMVDRAESIVRSMIFDEGEDDEETFELEIQRADGTTVPAEDHMTLLWDDAGEWFEGTAGIVRDITERKERDRRLSGLLDTTRSLMQAQTPEAVARTVVEAAETELGFDLNLVRLYDEETGTLRPVAGTESMPDRPVYDADEAFPGEAFQRGESIRIDDFDRIENYDSEQAQAAMYIPLGDHGVLSVATRDEAAFDDADVSVAEILASNAAAALSRVEREQDLLRYETVVENVRDMVYVLDEDGGFQLVTEPLADWLGYDRAELLGSHPRKVLDEEAVAAFSDQIRDLRRIDDDATITMETQLFTADGQPRPVEIEVSLLDDDLFRGTAGVVRDLTELKQAREKLQDERDRFSYLFNNLPDAVVETEVTDEGVVVRSVNPTFTDVFGLDHTAVLDSELDDALPTPTDDADSEVGHLLARGADGDIVQTEIRRRTDRGYRDFLFRGIPYRRDDGRVWSFGIYTDITEQKERQRRLQVLNRVLRHNLRNDLTVVMGLADEVADRLDDEATRSLVDRLQRKAAQIASLSDRAREIEQSVRRDDGDTEPIDVPETVRSLTATYADQYDVTVETTLPGESVRGGDGRLSRVIGELLENSIEHGGEGPVVSVAVEPTDDTVSVTVADDGPGIPDHELAVVTGDEPITQLRHGSGLGLWLVVWVVESYGGQVTFEDEDDGTTVTLSIPRTDR